MVQLAVRPKSFSGTVRVSALGPGRLSVRATGGRGSYRARVVFPKAGLWRLSARADGATSRLGPVRVRQATAKPVTFFEPTSIDLQPNGTLLLIEFSSGRVVRVAPSTGRVDVLVQGLYRPYAVVRAPSGSVYISIGNLLQRLNGAGTPTTVAEVPPGMEIGPIAAASNGDVYFATATQIFRLRGGSGPAVRVGGSTQFASPHGLAVAGDGAVLVSDRDNNRIIRLDPLTGAVSTFAQLDQPYGLDVAADGTVYVIEGASNRVVRLGQSGTRLGFLGPAFAIPYDVEVASGGVVYLLQAGPTGYIRRIAPDGSVTTVSRR